MRNKTRLISRWRRRQVVGGLLLAFVTLIGAGLRWHSFGEPPWLDELHTGWVVSAGPSGMAERAAAGNQASAYFWFPWLAAQALGFHATALRLPSLLAGVALIPACYALVLRGTRSHGAALVVAVLIAIDRDFVFYAVEARTYALVQLLGVLHVLAGLTAWRPRRRTARIIWLVSAVALFYLHYTTALLVAAEFTLAAVAWVAARAGRRSAGLPQPTHDPRDSLPRRLAVDLGIYLVAAAPMLFHLSTVAERRRNWGVTLSADSLVTLFPWAAYVVAPGVALVLSAVVRLIAGVPPWARWRRSALPVALLTLVGLSTLVAVAATASGEAQLQRFRYLILAATLLPCACGAALAMVANRNLRVVFALIVIGWAGLTSEPAVRLQYPGESGAARHERWSELIAQLESELETFDAPVLLCAGMVEDRQLIAPGVPPGWTSRRQLEIFCRFPLRSLAPLDLPDDALIPLPTTATPRTTSELRRRLAEAGGAWLIVRGSSGAAARIADEISAEVAEQFPSNSQAGRDRSSRIDSESKAGREFVSPFGAETVPNSAALPVAAQRFRKSYGSVTLVRLEFARGDADEGR